jgi:hypothetical protein
MILFRLEGYILRELTTDLSVGEQGLAEASVFSIKSENMRKTRFY